MLIPVKIHRFIQTLLDFSVGVENERMRSSKLDNWVRVRIKNVIAHSQTQNCLEAIAIQRRSHTKYMKMYQFSIGFLIEILSISRYVTDAVDLQL